MRAGQNQISEPFLEDLRQAQDQIIYTDTPTSSEGAIISRGRHTSSALCEEATIILNQREETWRIKKKDKGKKRRGTVSCPLNCKNYWSDFISDMREGEDGGGTKN